MSKKGNSRSAHGSAKPHKKTVMKNGKLYTYWEGRVTTGYDPGTGRQIQKSFTGKTQKEVLKKMQAIQVEVNNGTYREPCKMTVGEWLDIWQYDYLGGVKPFTVLKYAQYIRNQIIPALGAIKLEALNTPSIQRFYNSLGKPKGDKPGLSAKTIKGIHGVLHKSLSQAVAIGYLRFNPTDACKLPRMERKEIKPLDEKEISAFMNAAQGNRYEAILLVTLFTGLRRGEVCGLTWDCIDFKCGTILVNKQLQNIPGKPGEYHLVSSKNGRDRTITAAPFVMDVLKRHKAQQAKEQLKAGPLWQNNGFVFCNEMGERVSPHTVYDNFKKIAASIGRPDARLHDLRHSYAVAAFQAGDDPKTVQANLGHATATFTLDVYGHVTEKMKKDSANRMESFIQGISGL